MLPEKFEDTIRHQLGGEYAAFAASLDMPPPVSIRLHPSKDHGHASHPAVPWAKLGRYLETRPVFTLDPLFHAGSYYVQEASSMFLEQAIRQSADLDQPLNVLDLCAAPGGKSTHLLSLISRESLLVSNEAIRSRASILSENIQKWGFANTLVTNNDPADFRKLQSFFDVIVIDAPCSGEGLFRKDPRAMEEWSAENVQLCASRQKRILSDVWSALRENGILIYCTCTYNELENEDNLEWLRGQQHIEFLRLSTESAWGIEEVIRDGVIGYRFFPHRTKGEGFFLSVIRKKEASESFRMKNKSVVAPPSKAVQQRLREWVLPSVPVSFFQFNDLLFYAPQSKAKEFEFLLQNLKIVYAGTNLATLKHDKLIPDHALAMSVDLNRNVFLTADLSQAEALKYLRRDTLQLAGAAAGFTLITCRDVPLGWANVLPNRVNNMYPQEWRVRMKG
jgi:16S rRNA C967 or C1407 C5-methylase (RsmB/RsmF family)/NOL1/NOP2/fmu family ribosome biogenesis protein